MKVGCNILIAEEIFHSGYCQWDWGNGVENTLVGEITRLKVSSGDVDGSAISRVRFVMTPSALLRSADILAEQNGEIVVQKVVRKGPVCCTSPGITFHFASAYRRIAAGKLESNVECELAEPAQMRDPKGILSSLEDVLAVASLAERRVLMLTGWSLSYANGATATYYRRDFTVSSQEETDIDETLISLQDVEEFLNKSLYKLRSLPGPGGLKQAVYFALHGQARGIGDSFVMLFAGVETLLNLYDIRGANRSSFAVRFKQMCSLQKIDLADLWPMLGGRDSLYAVRNRIVHGRVFSSDQEWFRVISAKYHLLWTLERSILSILEWPVERSRVSAKGLCGMTLYGSWRSDREFFASAK
jgi:hypothetical protein